MNPTHCPQIKYIKLSDKDKNDIEKELSNISFDPYTKFPNILKLFNKKQLETLLNEIKLVKKSNTSFIFQNLPINRNLKEKNTSELMLLLLSYIIGEQYYINEDMKRNKIIQNVIPIISKEFENSRLGSLKTSNWHTENIHEKHPADYLILLESRIDKSSFTSIMLVEDIIKNLPEKMISELLTSKFLMKTDTSSLVEKSSIKSILTIENNSFSICYNSDNNMVIPCDIRGQELYYNFQELLDNIVPFHSINLKSGEALIINNNKTLHKI
jgi:hypothetical protein